MTADVGLANLVQAGGTNLVALARAAARPMVLDYRFKLAKAGGADLVALARAAARPMVRRDRYAAPQRHPRVRMVAGKLMVFVRGRPSRALDQQLERLFATWNPSLGS